MGSKNERSLSFLPRALAIQYCIIPAGVYDKENQKWIPAAYKYLFPVRAMSKVFQGKYLERLKEVWYSGQLEFPGDLGYLNQEEAFSHLLLQVYSKDWVVFAKRPFKSPQHLFDYLGRYSHKIAISNHRVISIEGDRIKFLYYDRETGEEKIVDLSRGQFVSRFPLHTLPSGFPKIRYYGFMASSVKKENLGKIAEILDQKAIPEKNIPATERILKLTGHDCDPLPLSRTGKAHQNL